MKILKMSWRNYKSLSGGQIAACGSDVLISGRNGSGKSTIAEIVPFVLFGKTNGTLKRYDAAGMAIRDGLIHGAEIEFDTVTLRREIIETANGNSTKYYVNGESVLKRKYDAAVENVTHGGGELVLNPFVFFNLTSKQQRDFVTRTFGASGREILSPPAEFGGKTAAVFIEECKTEHRRLKSEADRIPARMEELERQQSEAPTETMAELSAQIEMKRAEVTRLQTGTAQIELDGAKRRQSELERQKEYLARQIGGKEKQRLAMLAKYRELKSTTAGKCPTCGQAIPADLFEAKRDEKLLEIVTEGKSVTAEIGELKSELEATDGELGKLGVRMAELEKSAQSDKQSAARLAELNGEIASLEEKLLKVKASMAVACRLKELAAQERTLNEQLAELEGKQLRAEKYQHERLVLFEGQINGCFEHMRFKLFERLANGTLKETCEAMMDGVPYSSLSKGEKLKAALDLLRALQKVYGVEMPLILDDAESYTSNSFVELPNQKFYFRVSENDLAIEIMEASAAA